MHIGSMLRMKYFVENYVLPRTDNAQIEGISVLDVGSYNVNGCYKELFSESRFKYTGLDMEQGPNVESLK